MIDRAVIGAWVGSSNLGDELIFSILLRLLKEKGVKVSVPSVDPVKPVKALMWIPLAISIFLSLKNN